MRARATDNAGNVQPWPQDPQTQTTISTSGPVAWITPFTSPITSADNIFVQWTGQSSTGTSITYYNVRYQYKEGSWTVWQSQTPASTTSANFTDLRTEDGSYCFEAQALDSANRLGDYGGKQCIAVDRNPPFIVPQFYLPAMFVENDK